MSPSELQSCVEAVKSLIAQDKIRVRPDALPMRAKADPRKHNIRMGFRYDGRSRKRRVYRERLDQTGWTAEQKQERRRQLQHEWYFAQTRPHLQNGLTYQGEARRRRIYEPREDLSGFTPEQRKARLRGQQRRYRARVKAAHNTPQSCS